jgi:hypothetical protein
MQQKCEIVGEYIRVEHANSHRTRKGSATVAILGTTVPPLVSSIVARGEWKMGKVLDLYFQFAEPGDQYLGQVLVGLDVNSPKFSALPPHFNTDDPMSNEAFCEAMSSMYAVVLQKHAGTASDPMALLL